jgi:hypothetical protein
MSESNINKEGASKWSISLKLHFNNLQQWIDHLFKEISQTEKIDRIMFLKTEVEWSPKKRLAVPVLEGDEDEDGVNNKKVMDKLNQRLQLKIIEEIEYVRGHLHPRISNVMMKWISPQVEQALESHPKWKTWAGEVESADETTQVYAYGPREDPLALLKMLIDVTRRQRFVHNLVFQSNDVVKMRTERDTFVMRAGESYAEYELRWTRLKKDMLLSGIAPFEKVQQVPGEMQEVIVLFRGMRPNHPAKAHLQRLFKESINNPDAFPKTMTDLTKTVLDLEISTEFDSDANSGTPKRQDEKRHGKQIQFGNIAKLNQTSSKPATVNKPMHKYDPGQGMVTDIHCFRVTVPPLPELAIVTDEEDSGNESEISNQENDDEFVDLPDLISEGESDTNADSDGESETEPLETMTWEDAVARVNRDRRLPLPPTQLRHMMSELGIGRSADGNAPDAPDIDDLSVTNLSTFDHPTPAAGQENRIRSSVSAIAECQR